MPWFVLCLLLLLPLQAAQALELTTQLESQKGLVGEPLMLELKLNGTQDEVQLRLPQVPDLEILQTRPPLRSSQTTIINGTRTSFQGLVYHIQILPLKAGHFTIPPLRVLAQGKELHTQSFELWITAATSQTSPSAMRLTLQADRPRYYAGEAVTLRLTWSLLNEVTGYDLRWPFLDSSLQVEAAPPPASADLIKLGLGQFEVPFERSSLPQAGEVWTQLSRGFVVYPEQAGELLVPGARVTAQVMAGYERGLDFFGRPTRHPKTVNQFAQAAPLRLQILPLPQPAPQSFSGAVGEFAIKLVPQFNELQAGEPLSLRFEIEGQGRRQALTPPSLNAWGQALQVQPWSGGSDLPQGKAFTTEITPTTPGELTLAPLPWTFFNPKTGSYVTMSTAPLIIQVKPQQLLDQQEIQDHRQTLAPKPNPSAAARFLDPAQVPAYRPWWLLWLLLPPFCFAGVWVLLQLLRRPPPQQQNIFPQLKTAYIQAQAKVGQREEFYKLLEQLPLPQEPEWQAWGSAVRARRFHPLPPDVDLQKQDLARFQALLQNSRPSQAAP